VQSGGPRALLAIADRPPESLATNTRSFAPSLFVNVCMDGTSIQPTFDDGVQKQRELELVEVSAKSGKWVKV